jgi:hypothetical protein
VTEIVVAQRMWQRRDTTANWNSANPVLAAGEIGVELTSPPKMKVGDGVTAWTSLAYVGVGTLPAYMGATFDGGGADITVGYQCDLYVPYAFTISQVSLLADAAGAIVIDIWKDTYGNYPPTVADKITASAPPTLSAAAKSVDATLTGWTLPVAAGTTLRFNVNSCTGIKRCTLLIEGVKT